MSIKKSVIIIIAIAIATATVQAAETDDADKFYFIDLEVITPNRNLQVLDLAADFMDALGVTKVFIDNENTGVTARMDDQVSIRAPVGASQLTIREGDLFSYEIISNIVELPEVRSGRVRITCYVRLTLFSSDSTRCELAP